MTADNLLGTIGVALLLIGFALNLVGILDRHARLYHALNIGGAALLGIVAWRIGFIPLVVLEAVWVTVSALAFFRVINPRA